MTRMFDTKEEMINTYAQLAHNSKRESRNEIERLQNELADVVDAAKLALIEFERIGDQGFEPDRWQKRMEIVEALRQATAIDDLPF